MLRIIQNQHKILNMKRLITVLALSICALSTFAKDRPIVSNLEAIPSRGNKINLSWKLPQNPDPVIQKLIIYRSNKPVGTYYDISDSVLITSVDPKTVTYSDTVKNYNDYYYAIIAQVNNGKYDIILPSVNATVNGAHLKVPEKKDSKELTASAKEKLIPIDGMRETPLPFLDISEQVNRKPLELSGEVKGVALALGDKSRRTEKRLEPYIFEEDLISPDGGDDFLLFEILRTTFIQKKYKSSTEQLKKLLGTNRSKSVTKRATFYLGESYYYSKDYNNAVRTFLQIYDDYPLQAKKWIDASLNEVKIFD